MIIKTDDGGTVKFRGKQASYRAPRTTKVWYVDLPKAEGVGNPDNSWDNITTFHASVGDTRKDAVAFLKEHWGIPARYAGVFITEAVELEH